MDGLAQDIRYALRTLRQTPLLTGLAVLCLSLGIGANATMFSVVESALIRPLPFAEPDRLIDAWSSNPAGGVERTVVSYPDFLDWQRAARSLETLVAVQGRSLTFSGGEDPERVLGAAVSANLFSMLGVAPALGREIGPVDDVPGAPAVVLLSDELWRRRFHADPAIVGTVIAVDDRAHTVIGVLPPRVNFPFNQMAYVALAPLAHGYRRIDRDLELFGRLAPGATLEGARDELRAIAARLADVHPENDGWSAVVRPLHDYFAPDEVKLVTLAALGAVTLVLLIACANVANLLLARATARAREMSLRAALGAGRGRLVRQLLTEAIVLGLVSVPLGILLTDLGLALLTASMPADQIPYLIRFSVDRTTLLYTVASAALSSLVFGLAPAWQVSHANLVAALREGGRVGSAGARTRGRNLLVVVEVALAMILLVGASLFTRSFLNLQKADPGFDTAPLMTLRVFLPGERYREAGAKARRMEDITARIERLPGVRAAGASNNIPLDGGGDRSRVTIDGVAAEPGREPRTFFAGVTAHYLDAVGVPVLQGRGISDAEAQQPAPVAVVNVSFARRYLSTDAADRPAGSRADRRLLGAGDLEGIDAVGRRIRVLDVEGVPALTVVGVVPDFMPNEDYSRPPGPAVFAPYPFQETANTGITVRTAGDPAGLARAIRGAVRESDPALPIFAVATMEEVRRLGFWQYELFGWMFSIFGALALVLGSAGVYGVLSYAVSQRTQEFGVRIALGASTADVLKLTIGQGLWLVGAGVLAGIAGALAVTQVIGSLLYNVTPTDVVSFGAVILLLACVGLLASYLPARRASRVDPMVALRFE